MRIIKCLSFIAFCVYVLISCTKSEPLKNQSALSNKLVVDTTKLGLRSEIGGLSYRIPLNWQATDSSMMATLKLIAANEIGKFKLMPQSVYQNPSTGSFLTISRFNENPKANENFTSWARGFVDNYKLAHSKSKVQEEWLAISGQPAVQLLREDSMAIHCEFVVQGSSPLKFSFTVSLQKWSEEKTTVESSVGSIKKL